MRAEHPHTDNSSLEASESLIDRLRSLLLSIEEEQVESVAFEMQPKELRGLLHLLCLPEKEIVYSRAEKILSMRRRRDLLIPAWRLLVHNYPSRLQVAVGHLGNSFDWSPLARTPETAIQFRNWFAAESLVTGVLNDFLLTPPQADLSEWLPSVSIPRPTRLYGRVWLSVLTKPTRRIIERVGHSKLLKHAQEQQQVVQVEFARQYLIVLGGRDHWKVEVLEWIRSKFRTPGRREAQPTFWRPIPQGIRDEFRRWANEEVLREYFNSVHDPHGRFLFWKKFTNRIVEVSVDLGGQVGLIDFGHFGVVEFSHVGNAAYVYPISVFEQIRKTRAFNENDYKQKVNTLKHPSPGPNNDGRILHYSGWQERYYSWIKDLTR